MVERPNSSEGLRRTICGGTAGCVAKTCVAPFTRLVILMQVQSLQPSSGGRYGAIETVKHIYRQEGVLVFWRGNGVMILHRFPACGLKFEGTHFFKKQLERRVPALSLYWRSFFGGALGASCATAVVYPLDVVKTRLTIQRKRHFHYKGILDALHKIPKEEGFFGFYRGFGVSLLVVVPTIGFNFAFYDSFRDWSKTSSTAMAYPMLSGILCGAAAGGLASTITFPLDLVKRQMQVDSIGGKRQDAAKSILEAIARVAQVGRKAANGRYPKFLRIAREFYRGFVPEIIKVVPNCAIMFHVNEYLLSRMDEE